MGFMQALQPGAHPEYFSVSQCFHRSQDFILEQKKRSFLAKHKITLVSKKKRECFESVLIPAEH